MDDNTPSPDSRDRAVEDWLERTQMDPNQPIRDEMREPMERMLPRRPASLSRLQRRTPLTFENPSGFARSRSRSNARRRPTRLTVGDLPSNPRRPGPPTLSNSPGLQRDASSSFGNLPSNFGSERIPTVSSSPRRQVPIPSTLDNLLDNPRSERPLSQSNSPSRQTPIISTSSLPCRPTTVSEHPLADVNFPSSRTSFPPRLPLRNNQLPNIFTMSSSLTSSGSPFDSNRPSLGINRLPDTLASPSNRTCPPEDSNHPSRNSPLLDTFILPSIRCSTRPTADWNQPTVGDQNPSQSTLAVPYRVEGLGDQSTDSNRQEDVRPSIIENIAADGNQEQVSYPLNVRRHSTPCTLRNTAQSSQLALVGNRTVTLKLEASGGDVSEESTSSEDYERPLEIRSYLARQASSLQGPVVMPDNLSRIELPDDDREYCFSLTRRYIDLLPYIPDDELQEEQGFLTRTPSSEPFWSSSATAGDSDMDCEKLDVEYEDLLAARSERIWSSLATAGDSDVDSENLDLESEDTLAVTEPQILSPGQRNTGALPKQPSDFQRKCLQLLQSKSTSRSTKNNRMTRSQQNVQDFQPNISQSQIALPEPSYQFFSPLPPLFPSIQSRLRYTGYAQRHRINLATSPLRCSRMFIGPLSEPRGQYHLSGTSHDQAQGGNFSHSIIPYRRSYPPPPHMPSVSPPLRFPRRASIDFSEHCSDSNSPSPDRPIIRRTIDIYLPREHASPIQNEASSRYHAGAVIERTIRVFPHRLNELIQAESVRQAQNVPGDQHLDTFIPSGEPSTEMFVEPGTEILMEPSTQVVVEPDTEILLEPNTQILLEPGTQIIVEPSTQILVEPSNEMGVSTSQTSGEPNNQTLGEPNNQTLGEPNNQTLGEPNNQTSGEPNNQTSGEPNSQNIDEPNQTSSVHGSRTFSEHSRQTLSRHSSPTLGGGGSSNTIYGLKREFINRKRPGLLAEYEAVFGKKLSSKLNSSVSKSRSRELNSKLSDTLNQTSSGHPSAQLNDQHSGEPSCPIMCEPRSEHAGITQQANLIADYLARPPPSNVFSRSQSAPSSRTQSGPSIQLPNRLSIPVDSRGHPQYEHQDNLNGITLHRSTSLPSIESNDQQFVRPSRSTLNSVSQPSGHPQSGTSGHPQSGSSGHPQSGSSGHPQSGSSGHPQSGSRGQPQSGCSGQPQTQEQPEIDLDSVFQKGPKSARRRRLGSPSQRRHSPLIGPRNPSQIGLQGSPLKEHKNENNRGPNSDPQSVPVSGHDQLQKGTVQKCKSSDEPSGPTLVPSSAQFLSNAAEQDSKLVCDSSNQTSGDSNTEFKVETSSQPLAEPSSQQLRGSSSPPMCDPIRRLEYFKQFMKPVVVRQSLLAEYNAIFGKPAFSNAQNIRSQSAPCGRSQSSLLPDSGLEPRDRYVSESESRDRYVSEPTDQLQADQSQPQSGPSFQPECRRSPTHCDQRSPTSSGRKDHTASGHSSSTCHRSLTPSGHSSASTVHRSLTPSVHISASTGHNATPSGHRSATPSGHRSATPSGHRSATPSGHRSATPSGHRSATPSGHRSATPSDHRSTTPSDHRSTTPSGHSTTPSGHRSTTPSGRKNPTPSGHNRSQNEYSGLPQSGHASQPQSVAASLTSEQGSFVFKQPIGPVRRPNSQSVKQSSQNQTPSQGVSRKGSNVSLDRVSQEILKLSSNAQTSNVNPSQKESQTSSQPASQTDTMPTAMDLSSGRKLKDKMASSSSVTHSLEDRSPRGNVQQSRLCASLNQFSMRNTTPSSGPQSSLCQQSSVNNIRPQIFGSQQALRGPPEHHSLFQSSLMYNARASRSHSQRMNDLRPLITPLTLQQRSINIRPRPSPRSYPLQVAPLDFSLPAPQSLPVTRRQMVQTAEHHHMPLAQPVIAQTRVRTPTRRNISLRRLDRSQSSVEFQPSQSESFNNNIQMVEPQSIQIESVDTNMPALKPQSLQSESLDSEMLETQSLQSESLDFLSTDVDSDMPSLKPDSLQSESIDIMSTNVDSDMPSLKTESLPNECLDNLMSNDEPIPTRMESVDIDVQRDEPMQTQSESCDSKMPSAEPMQMHSESLDSDTPSLEPQPLQSESLDNVIPTVETVMSPGDFVDIEIQRNETQPTQSESFDCNLPTDEPQSLQNESLDKAVTTVEPLLLQSESLGTDIQRDEPQSTQNETLNFDQSSGGARPKLKKKSSKKDSRRRGSKSSTSSSISGTERRVLIKITCPECAAKRGITLTKKQLSLYFKNKDTVGKCCCYRCYVFLRPGEVHPMRQISCQELPGRPLTFIPEETGESTTELITSQRPVEQEVSSDLSEELPQDNLQSGEVSRPSQQHGEGNDFTEEENQGSLEDSERMTQPMGDETMPDPSVVGVNNGASFGTSISQSVTGSSERPSRQTYPGLLETWESGTLDPGFFTLDVNNVRNMLSDLARTFDNVHVMEAISEESSGDTDN